MQDSYALEGDEQDELTNDLKKILQLNEMNALKNLREQNELTNKLKKILFLNETLTIKFLRKAGYAVVIIPPDELKGGDPKRAEAYLMNCSYNIRNLY